MANLEYKIPTLNPGPVKKEIMQCIRDIALDDQNIRYYDYTDGIIAGCGLFEENMSIGLINGLVKYGGRIYKLNEKAAVPYENTDSWTSLKLCFSPQNRHSEYIHFTADLVLDPDVALKPNEMEMGRFKLKRGSVLRTAYKDFWDMATEYDTVNLLYVNYSAKHSSTLSPEITAHFAREAFGFLSENALDSAFCIQCLSSGGAVPRELITRYVCRRLGKGYADMDNIQLHGALAEILDMITGRARGDKGKGHKDKIMLIN